MDQSTMSPAWRNAFAARSVDQRLSRRGADSIDLIAQKEQKEELLAKTS
jgi:hypothetical protein